MVFSDSRFCSSDAVPIYLASYSPSTRPVGLGNFDDSAIGSQFLTRPGWRTPPANQPIPNNKRRFDMRSASRWFTPITVTLRSGHSVQCLTGTDFQLMGCRGHPLLASKLCVLRILMRSKRRGHRSSKYCCRPRRRSLGAKAWTCVHQSRQWRPEPRVWCR